MSDPSDKREQLHTEKFRLGHTRQLNFELQLTESVSVTANFHESKFPRSAESVPFDQLPASFRQAVAAAEKQAMSRPGPGVRKQPPP